MENFSNPNTTFKDVMFNTPYYPTVFFTPLANSPKLKARRWSTWMKDRVYGKEVGGVQNVLLQCHTFEVPQNVTLGTFESKVSPK